MNISKTYFRYRVKLDMSKQNLNRLRSDVDELKMQIHKVSIQIEDTVRENSTLKKMCDNRSAEIT